MVRLVLAVHDDADTLQIQQDIDHVFLDAVDGGVFVQHALDTAVDDRAAAYRRQQDASQRIAERVTETALQRLDQSTF